MSNYKYSIEQYHAIESAQLLLRGITVLAGINGCGKSTLSRWLYYIINTAAYFDENLFYEIKSAVTKSIRDYEDIYDDIYGARNNDEILSKAIRAIKKIQFEGEESVDDLLSVYNATTQHFAEILYDILSTNLDQSKEKRILNYLGIEKNDNETYESIKERFLIESINSGEKAKETYQKYQSERSIDKFARMIARNYREQDEMPTNLHFAEDGVDLIVNGRLNSIYGIDNAIYIDTPMALYESDSNISYWRDLQQLILEKEEHIENEETIKKILFRIRRITGGKIEEKKDILGDIELRFVSKDNQLNIRLEDTATGIKSFAYLERLLINGHLNSHTLLLIDEPEAHLHPEWVVEFAHLLVLLHKEMGVKIMIASHNPDMVSAIRYIAEKEQVLEDTNFYQAVRNNETQKYVYQDLQQDIEGIFASFNKAIAKIDTYGSSSL